MKTTLFDLHNGEWRTAAGVRETTEDKPQLIICFGSKKRLSDPGIYDSVKKRFPVSDITMCSTAGEILNNTVQDDSVVAVALTFKDTKIQTALVNIGDYKSSFEAAGALVNKLPKKELAYILVFSDGGIVNGSELVKGLNDAVDNKILITGGLAGDGADFNSTLVGLNSNPCNGNIVAIGFYGKKIMVTHGSQGGWDSFGPEREVTGSEGNKLFRIDHQNALDLYIKYLGPDAERLPASALLFPLSVILPGATEPVVRTILSIDRVKKDMTFAGDIPEGSKVRFMKGNLDHLTAAAASAAFNTVNQIDYPSTFALLVSCVGRKLILGARIEEEVEAVQDSLNSKTLMAGFYSYGEISPFNEGGKCHLHNQTMTITSFYEHA